MNFIIMQIFKQLWIHLRQNKYTSLGFNPLLGYKCKYKGLDDDDDDDDDDDNIKYSILNIKTSFGILIESTKSFPIEFDNLSPS